MRTPTTYLAIVAGAAALAGVLLWPRWYRPQPRNPPRPAASTGTAPSASARPSVATALASAPSATTTTGPVPDDGLCPSDMIYVEGNYCPFVAHRCNKYVGGEPDPTGDFRRDRVRRCQQYRDTLLCEGRPSRLHFCIARYEYPGVPGVRPAVMSTHRQAKQACAAEGKRLCYADEWAFACEGKRTLPFPYGLTRDATRCQLDRPTPRANRAALSNPHDVSMEVQRLDRRLPSAQQPRCVSPFQVFDTVGNVGEWVIDRQGDSLRAVAGGYWGKTKGTCRSLRSGTRSGYRSEHTGFRCCSNARDGRPARRLLPSEARLAKRRRLLP